MSVAEIPSSDRPVPVDELRSRVRRVQAVLERLDARAALADEAKEIVRGLASGSEDRREFDRSGMFVGEMDSTTICKSPGTQYDCDDAANFYNCNATQYNCKAGGTNTGYYACGYFSCTPQGGTVYNCAAEYDFICGTSHTCFPTKFDCSGGHVYACTSTYRCSPNFTCSATGNKDCDDTNKFAGSGHDDKPGDFYCGFEGGDSDSFQCGTVKNSSFNCNAKSDFVCLDSTKFRCDGGTDNTSKFSCENSFFTCDTMAKFTCNPNLGYTPCDQDKFSCNKTYSYTF